MPISKRNGKYYWGSKGPFDSREKAAEVAQAAHASGYEGSVDMHKQDEYGEYERYKKILENSPHGLATLREHHLGHKAIDQLAQEQLSNEDFGGERKRIHVINWWDREHKMHPYNDWQRSGKRTSQTNKPYNPDAQIGLWDFHRNYLEDFVDYHNDQQKPGKIGGAAWDRYQNMYADVGEGAHPATSDLNNLKRVTERMMKQGIYNPHDVEDVPEDFPQYKAVQKLMNFTQKANEASEYAALRAEGYEEDEHEALDEFGYNKPEAQAPWTTWPYPLPPSGLSRPMPLTTGRIRGATEKPEFLSDEFGHVKPSRAERNRALITHHTPRMGSGYSQSFRPGLGGYTKVGSDPRPHPTYGPTKYDAYSSRELSAEERAEALGIDTSRPFPREMLRVGTDDELAALYDEEGEESPEQREARRAYNREYTQKYRDTRSPEQHEADKARQKEQSRTPEYRATKNARLRRQTERRRAERETQGFHLSPVSTPEEARERSLQRQREYSRKRVSDLTPEQKAARTEARRIRKKELREERRSKPSEDKEGSMQKLLGFVQIQKIGYPDPQESYPKGFNMQQSAGLPSPESKDGQKVGEIARKMQPNEYYDSYSPMHTESFLSPLNAAHSYIRLLQEDTGGHMGGGSGYRTEGRSTHPDFGMHLAGHQAIATVHNILKFGEDYLNHPDAINYRRHVPNPDYGRGSTEQYLDEPQLPNALKEPHGKGMQERMSVEYFHRNLLRANMHPTLSHDAAGMADDLHRRIRQVSPAYHPDDGTSYNKLQAPGSWETSFAESAPLPPEGEDEGDVSAEEMLLPRGIPYNRGEAWPKDRYGRYYRETMPGMEPRRSDTNADTPSGSTLHRYPSMRGRRESYKDPDEQLQTPEREAGGRYGLGVPLHQRRPNAAETIRDYPSQNRSRYAPKPTKDAFERRFPDLYDKEKAVSKLMKFVQKAEEDDGIEGFRRHMGDEIQRQVDKNRPHTEWEDTHPDLFLPVGHDNAPLFLEPEEKGGKRVPSVHYYAYNYVDKIHRDVPLTANQHADGLKQVHRSDMLQRRGDAVRDMDYDDAFPLGRAMPKIPPRNAPKGQRPSQEYLDTTRKEMNIHDFLTDHTESMLSKVPSQHQEGVKRMFDKVAFESPSYKPTGSFETDPDIQQYFAIEQSLRKEGDGGGDGGAFNGLSGTVFTSTNAGIFTPTYGGDRTRRKHEKRHNKQEHKRKKLLGKEKKSGVDRLIQYLYDGSPMSKTILNKAGKKGLAPGLNDNMTGDGATAHAWNNKATGRKILDWQKVAENNEPHVNMGMAGGMEAGIAAAYPQEEDPSVNNATTPRKAEWRNGAYVQKSAGEGTTMISATENRPADGPHPQQEFIERTKDNPNEPPAKDAVVKENDMQRRVKKYDNKEEDTNHEQPAGAMATAGMGGYPSGATMQMSSFGMNTYEQDSLARGGEEDKGHDEEEIDENEEGLRWVPEAEKVEKLEAMRKELEDSGDATPLLTALLKVDYASSK